MDIKISANSHSIAVNQHPEATQNMDILIESVYESMYVQQITSKQQEKCSQ